MTAIDDLLTRTIDDGTDRLSWLQARQGRITASMVAKFLTGGAAARREVLEASFEPPVEMTGNKYIDRGHEREPVIAAWINHHWPTIHPNQRLFAGIDNTRHAATPDGIGVDPKGRLVMAEIKTSKYDRSPDDPYFPKTGYLEQMQWQMHVTGAIATLYVWEQHDDDWDTGPTPLHDNPRHVWVRRDERLISQLVAAADLALAERDQMAAEYESAIEPEVDEEIARLAAEVLDARRDEAAAKARVKTPWTRLLTEVDNRPEFSRRHGRALVTWSNRTTEAWEPDEMAALTAPVEGSTIDLGADLKERLDMAREAWETHQAKHMRLVERSVRKLTITEPKVKTAPLGEDEF